MTQTPLSGLMGNEQRARFIADAFPQLPFHTQVPVDQLPEWARHAAWHDCKLWDSLYTGSVDVTRGGRAQYRVAGAAVSAWVEDLELAVRLDTLEDHLPGAREWLRAVESELGLPKNSATLAAFLNAPRVGLGAHCDTHEVLVIHLHGRKRFRFLAEPPRTHRSVAHACAFPPNPRVGLQFADGFPAWTNGLPAAAQEVVLEPGSVLYMPRGCWHETRGGDDGVSITATVVLKAPSYADLFLEHLRDYLTQSAAWRTPLLGSSQEHVHALSSLLASDTPSFAHLNVERMLHRDAEALHDETRWVRDPSVLIDSTDCKLRVRRALGRGATDEFALSPETCELVLTIAEIRRPISWASLRGRLPAWDESALTTVVRFMLAKKLLVRLPGESYPCHPPVMELGSSDALCSRLHEAEDAARAANAVGARGRVRGGSYG